MPRWVPAPHTPDCCCSAEEFTSELSAVAARRADVELIDLDRLYYGS